MVLLCKPQIAKPNCKELDLFIIFIILFCFVWQVKGKSLIGCLLDEHQKDRHCFVQVQGCCCFFLLSKGTHRCVPGGGGAGLCPGMNPTCCCCGGTVACWDCCCWYSVPGPLAIPDVGCGGGGGAGRVWGTTRCPAIGVILVGGGVDGGGTFGAGRDGEGMKACALT